MKMIKGRSYIMFGNFPAADATAKEISDSLGVSVVLMLSNTDNVSIIEYEAVDTELEQLRKENRELKAKLKKKWI